MGERDLYEAVRELRRKVEELHRRLELLEKLASGPEAEELRALLAVLDLGLWPYGEPLAVVERYLFVKRCLRDEAVARDPIARAILQVLMVLGPLNVSEVAHYVRKVRGTASRGVVSRRLERLEELGYVRRVPGKGKRYDLNV